MKTMEERIFEQMSRINDDQKISFVALIEALYKKGILTEEECNSIINNK